MASHRSDDGRTWLVQAAPVRDHKGGIIGGMEITLDITKYKHVEEVLHEMETPAEVKDPAEHEA
jgi:hypothetical protein